MRKKRMTAALLTAVFFIGTISSQASQDVKFEGYDDSGIVHADIDYKDMEYTVYDAQILEDILAELQAACEKTGNEETVIRMYDQAIAEYDRFSTLLTISNNRYYSDITNETYQEEYAAYALMATELYDALFLSVEAALSSDCGEALEAHIGNPYRVECMSSYLMIDDEEEQLFIRISELQQQYQQLINEEYTYESGNVTWTEEMTAVLPEEDAMPILIQIARNRNQAVMPVFLELVTTMNNIAQIYGYDTYASYAYENDYLRDYTTEEATALYAIAKEYFVPILLRIDELLLQYDIYDLFYMEDLTEETVLNTVGTYISKVHPALQEAYDYLLQYHLYDISYQEEKAYTGYTSSLYAYNEPFIFNRPDYWYIDIEDMIHEFGHFNYEFHHPSCAAFSELSFDTAELHSQGLEVLYLPFADEMFGSQNRDAVELLVLRNLVSSLIDGCLYDEFQQEVYALEREQSLDGTETNRIMRRLAEEYGYQHAGQGDEAYDWVLNSHTFESPFYYISYAVSAINALDLFDLSRQDYRRAADTYMQITAFDPMKPYREVLKESGLPDCFDTEVLKGIADRLNGYLNRFDKDYGLQEAA